MELLEICNEIRICLKENKPNTRSKKGNKLREMTSAISLKIAEVLSLHITESRRE